MTSYFVSTNYTLCPQAILVSQGSELNSHLYASFHVTWRTKRKHFVSIIASTFYSLVLINTVPIEFKIRKQNMDHKMVLESVTNAELVAVWTINILN